LNFFKPLRYEELKILKNISFDVKEGQWFGIIGKNGCGKSTLLKIIAGIYSYDHGTVNIKKKIIPLLDLGIGFNDEFSAIQNIYINSSLLGLSKEEITKKLEDILTFADLEMFRDTPLKNYSSGMRMRLAFSIVVHAEGDIYLLDEILAVGDQNFQNKCKEVF